MSLLKTKLSFIRNNLVLKILIAVFLATWLPVAGLLAYSTYVTRMSFIDNAKSYFENSLNNYSTAVDQKMFHLESEIKSLSAQQSIVDYLTQPSQVNLLKLNNSLNNQSSITESWKDLYVADASGKIIYSKDKSGRQVEQSIFTLDETGEKYRYLRDTNTFLTDTLSTSGPAGEIVVLKSIQSPRDGRVLGYVAATYPLENLNSLLQVASNDTVLIYNKDQKNILQTGAAFSPEKIQNINQTFVQNSKANNDKLIEIEGTNSLVILPEFKSGNISKLKWRVAGVINTASLLKVVDDFRFKVYLVAIALLVFVNVALVFFLTKVITIPLDEVKRVSQEVAAGNYNERIKVSDRSDVIGRLEYAVNDMAMSLVNEHSNLEHRVELQTKQLSVKVSDLEKAKSATLNLLEDLDSAKNQLEETKNKDEALLSSIGDGVFAIDVNSKVILFNNAASKITGFDEKEVIGKRYDEILKFSIKAEQIKTPGFIEQSLGGKSAKMQKTTYIKHKRGSLIPVDDSASPVYEDGKVVGAIVVFRDITQELQTDLAKTEFVSLASHQLKTPLTAISWYSEILLKEGDKKLSPEFKKYVNEIAVGNKRMIELVNALLNVSRLELGTVAINPEELDFANLIAGIESELSHSIAENRQKLSIKLDAHLPKVKTDPQLARIIIQNLLTNAIKYSPPKSAIELTLKHFTKAALVGGRRVDKDSVLLSVKDHGYGIPQTDQSKVFGKLFRADNIKMKNTDGTGLGLYMCQLLADILKSKLWFKSSINRGTTFYFTIPFDAKLKKSGTKELEKGGSI